METLDRVNDGKRRLQMLIEALRAEQSVLPKIKLMLAPIMDRQARDVFRRIETNSSNQNWVKEYGPYYAIAVVRSVVATRTPPNFRIRQGLLMLMDLLKTTPQQALKSLNHTHYLRKVVLQPGDPPELVDVVRNYISWLGNTTTKSAVLRDMQVRAYQESQNRLEHSETKRKSQVLSGHESRRLKEKARLLAELEQSRRIEKEKSRLLAEEEQRRLERKRANEERKRQKPKRPMRWLA